MAHRGTETVSDRFAKMDTWASDDIVAALLQGQLQAAASVAHLSPLIAQAVDAAVERLAHGEGRIIYVGAGASGRLAVQDGVELFPTYGWPHARLVYLMAGGEQALVLSVEGAEDEADVARDAVRALSPGPSDVMISVAASGRTPYACAAAEAARAAGVLIIGVMNNPDTALAAQSDFALAALSGPEVVAGSTRMGAGTAQKIVLNMLSSAIMVRLKRVFDNVMVDLSSHNDKLNGRRLRILNHIVPRDEATLRATLKMANNNIKLAALMLHGETMDVARDRLRRAGGDLRAALNEI